MPPKKNAKGKGKGRDTDNTPQEGKKSQQQQHHHQKKEEKNPHEGLPLYLTEGTTQKDRDVILEFSLSTPNNSRILVNQATLRLVYGRHYGLIGQNGIGKTTLLNAISQYQLAGFPQYLRVVHVHQEEIPRGDIHIPVIDYVIQSDVVKNFLEAEEQRLLDLMENNKENENGGGDDDDDQGDLDMSQFQKYEAQLDEVYRRLDTIGARTATARARAILTGLQFTQEMQDNPISKLSGGWKMRVRLACALFVTPDILLLDEPTNHLDFPAVEWLSSFLRCYEATLLVVSHDRGFLDNIMTDCIDFRDQTLMYYRGDYSNYVKVRAETIKRHNKLWEKTEKKRQALHKFIMEARQKAKDDPNLAEMARSRQRILDSLPQLEEIKADKAIHFSFPDPGSLDHAIVSCKGMSFHYDPEVNGVNKPYLLHNIDAFIDLESRIGVLGANGAGKTTMINVLLGKLRASKGEVKLNDQARAKIFTQHHLDQLDNSMSALQFLQHKFPQQNEGMLRGYLGRFGFDKILAEQKIDKLSGGQKSRVAFAVLTFSQPHLVIMDEPTNHLDIETIESLIEALNAFKGGVIIISHDRYFLSQIAHEYWAVDARGTMKIYYDLEEAKNYAYQPIEFKVDGVLVKSTAKLHKADPNKMKQYDVENDEDIRYRELESAYDDDDDDDDDAILSKLDKKAGDLERINAKKQQPKKADKPTVYKMNLPADLGKGKKKQQESSEEEQDFGYTAAKAKGFSAFAFGDDDDEEEEEEPEEEEEETYVPVIHTHVHVNKKKQAKREAAAAAAEEQRIAEEAARKAEEEAEAARQAAAEAEAKKGAKGKKGKKTKASMDDGDEDLDAQLALLTASLEDAGEDTAPKKKGKKGKKAKAGDNDDDGDDLEAQLALLAASLEADAGEENAAPKKKGKKGKKAQIEEEEEPELDLDLDSLLAGLAVDDDDEDVGPKKKGKKGKKGAATAAAPAADDADIDVDAMLAELVADEDAALKKDKLKAKRAAKAAAAAAAEEEDESATVAKTAQQAKRRGK